MYYIVAVYASIIFCLFFSRAFCDIAMSSPRNVSPPHRRREGDYAPVDTDVAGMARIFDTCWISAIRFHHSFWESLVKTKNDSLKIGEVKDFYQGKFLKVEITSKPR